MQLLFGLGNTGKNYDGTRHNLGFRVLDILAGEHNVTWQEKSKYKAATAEIMVNSEKIILAKPSTFYNNVGESYRALVDFYKLSAEQTLVIHDELMLPLGTIRTRQGGSDAGNNGVKSINQHGGEASARLRIGIGSDQRHVMGDTDFVLGKFSKQEAEKVDASLETALEFCSKFIRDEFDVTSVSHD